MRPVKRRPPVQRQQHLGHHQHRQQQAAGKAPPVVLRLINALFAQLVQQQPGVQAGAQANGQRQPGVLERNNKHQIHHLSAAQGDHGNAHRGFHVLPGVKPRRQHLDQNQPNQANRVGNQRLLGHCHIVGVELAIHE